MQTIFELPPQLFRFKCHIAREMGGYIGIYSALQLLHDLVILNFKGCNDEEKTIKTIKFFLYILFVTSNILECSVLDFSVDVRAFVIELSKIPSFFFQYFKYLVSGKRVNWYISITSTERVKYFSDVNYLIVDLFCM